MSVFFAILKGPYDSLLNWPFVCPVTVTLLDQMTGRDQEQQGKPRDVSRTFTPNPRPENEPFLGRPVENRNMSLGQQKKFNLLLSLLVSTHTQFVLVITLSAPSLKN